MSSKLLLNECESKCEKGGAGLVEWRSLRFSESGTSQNDFYIYFRPNLN